MVDIVASATFTAWLKGMRDARGQAIVARRIERLAAGNAGDVKPVGVGVSELRIAFGPGYRIYFKTVGGRLILLLAGGDKSTQPADIAKAKRVAEAWEQEIGRDL